MDIRYRWEVIGEQRSGLMEEKRGHSFIDISMSPAPMPVRLENVFRGVG